MWLNCQRLISHYDMENSAAVPMRSPGLVRASVPQRMNRLCVTYSGVGVGASCSFDDARGATTDQPDFAQHKRKSLRMQRNWKAETGT